MAVFIVEVGHERAEHGLAVGGVMLKSRLLSGEGVVCLWRVLG